MEYKIIIPNYFQRGWTWQGRISHYTGCLLVLPLFDHRISVISDNDLLLSKVSHILPDHPVMANKNGDLPNFFSVNDHIFMGVSTDVPTKNASSWVPYYSKYVSGFFVDCYLRSITYIFTHCPVPVFSLSPRIAKDLPMHLFEHNAHSKAVTTERDISVFFRGRYNTRGPRKYLAQLVQSNISNTKISNSGDSKNMPGSVYVDLMIRSKIAWCPRSVKTPPDSNCNAGGGRDTEGMCLESLVVRPSIGLIEREKRIPGVHFVEYRNDNADLIEKLQYYLEHENERKEIAHNGRLWWERNCSSVARAKRIFLDCLSAIGLEYEF